MIWFVKGAGHPKSTDITNQISSGIAEMDLNCKTASPTVTVAVAPNKPAAVVKGFEVPPSNKAGSHLNFLFLSISDYYLFFYAYTSWILCDELVDETFE